MVENADCRYSLRKLILVELFRTDQLARPAGRERTGSRIKAGEWQEPTKLGMLRLWLSLALSKLGDGCTWHEPHRDTNQKNPMKTCPP